MNSQAIKLENVLASMTFTIYFENELEEEISLLVENAKDIEKNMKLYFEKAWEELFYKEWDGEPIEEVTFEGISFYNSDNSIAQAYMGIDGQRKKSNLIIDTDAIGVENAEKLRKISEIIGK